MFKINPKPLNKNNNNRVVIIAFEIVFVTMFTFDDISIPKNILFLVNITTFVRVGMSSKIHAKQYRYFVQLVKINITMYFILLYLAKKKRKFYQRKQNWSARKVKEKILKK